MSTVLVKISLFRPGPLGDTVPCNGHVDFAPTRRRHIEGGDPDDFIVLPTRFSARLGDPLLDDDGNIVTAGEPGIAWVNLEATDVAPYANQWAWRRVERIANGETSYVFVASSPSTQDYADLETVDPDSFDPVAGPTPAWAAPLASEAATRAAADTAESAARAAADAAETLARANADVTLGSAITAEATARAAADTAEATARSSADSTEASTRAAADTTNANAITAEAALARNASNLTSGTVPDARLTATLPSALATVGDRAIAEAAAAEQALLDASADGGLIGDGRVATDLLDGQNTQSYGLSNCTAANDTTLIKQGTQSKRFTTSGAVTATAFVDPVFPGPAPDPLTFSAASIVRTWVWVDDPTKLTSLAVEIYSDSGASVKWSRTYSSFTAGWNLVQSPAADGTTTGWGSVYRVRLVAVSSAATAFNIGRLWVESPRKAKMIFIADRGYKSFKDNALPDLRSRNIPVTWAMDPLLNGSNPGTISEACTDADFATFYAAGDDLSVHSYDGTSTNTKTGPQLVEDALRALQWLHDRDYTRGRTFRAAWVQNDAPAYAAASPYFAAMATWNNLSASTTCYPFPDRYNVPRYGLHGRTTGDIDTLFSTLATTKGTVLVYLHGIDAGGGNNVTPTMWTYIVGKIDAAIAAGTMEFTQFSKILNYRQQVANTITYGTNSAQQVTQYTTPQTDTAYAIPTGAKKLIIRGSGPGGAAGSGRRGAAGSVRCGGGGGGPAGYFEWEVAVSDLAVSTLYVTVGTAGTGGAAVTADNTNGNAGSAGTATMVKTSTSTTAIGNTLAYATAGGAGAGGTNATGTGGSVGIGRWIGAAGASASTTGLVGPAGSGASSAPGSGAAGGGLTTGDAQSAGGVGGYAAGRFNSTPAAGPAGGATPGANGANPAQLGSGSGGGGGGSTATGAAAGDGGNGGNGAGGGGGGASLNGNNSGKGGDGGPAWVEITATF